MTVRSLLISILVLYASSASVHAGSETASGDRQVRIDLAEITEGATLDELLAGMGLNRRMRANLANGLAQSVDPRKLRPGQWMAVRFNAHSTVVESMVLHLGRGRRAVVERTGERRFESEILRSDRSEVESTERFKIEGSLAKSAQENDVPAVVIAQLEAALGEHIDFKQAIQGGESVRLTFVQQLTGSGKPTHSELVFGRLSLTRYIITVARSDDGGWIVNREDPLSGHFRRPIDFARITSGFGLRKHPISGQWKHHNGIDYGAARGTPVYASAPGRVVFLGHQRGYGRTVEIHHRDGLSTLYAHLHAFSEGLEEGHVIGIGAQIGSVGDSGTATGPNLHFEVRHHGEPIDPLETAAAFLPSVESGSQIASAD